MKLEHVCSLDWMTARQNYLTASDIKALLPVTATGRPRKIGDKDRLKVWASKSSNLSRDDCVSTGAAARGHILEPFAIDKWNKHSKCEPHLAHWDDIVVYGEIPHLKVQPAFSPDAVSIAMPKGVFQICEKSLLPGTVIGEVKCYSHERHVATAYSDPMELEERWQIAHAMYTCDAIKEGWLILFDPSMSSMQMFSTCYKRVDLCDEIETIGKVVYEYNEFVASMPTSKMYRIPGNKGLEEKIMDMYLELQKSKRLNP